MKNKFIRIGTIVVSIIIVIGFLLTMHICSEIKRKNLIKVNIDVNETKVVKFKNLCLIPGERCEYIIILNSELNRECEVTFKFSEIEEQTLKNYVYVVIEKDDEVISKELLTDYFESEGLEIKVDFTNEKKKEIKVSYYLPEDVGNEAQNAEATFELLITAINK